MAISVKGKKNFMKKIKLKKRIFTKLIASFLLFLLLVLLTWVACLLFYAAVIGEGTIDNIMPYSVVDADGNVGNIDSVTELGGWVEELDSKYQVIKVYGDKKTDIQKYTQDDIYELMAIRETKDYTGVYLDFDTDTQGYMGFIYKAENADKYFLCIYSRKVMRVNPTIILNGDTTSAAYDKSGIFSILFLVLLVLEILLFSRYLRKKIKNPLDRLVGGMERIRSGESGVVLDIKTEAEFEQIVDTFNLMTQELEKQKKENARLVAQKNQILLELSHDIKTPIATIKSYANALEAGLVPEEKRQGYYHTIDIKADMVQTFTEDMFLMLKMDNPDYNVVKKKVNICECLRKICAEYYDEIAERGFDFIIDIPEEDFMTDMDVKLFTRVVGNLLSNAWKYNKTGNSIGIACEKIDDGFCIKVTDDGELIEEELASRMFLAFVRGDKTRKSDGGTGLGLSISKIIVEKHGGTIGYLRENGKNVFAITI